MSITRKASFVVGWSEDAELVFTLSTADAGEAKQVYEDILNGVHAEAKEKGVFFVQLFLKPNWDRRRDVPAKPLKKRRGRPPKAKTEQTGDASTVSAPAPVLPPDPEPDEFNSPSEPEQVPPHAQAEQNS